MPARHHTIHFPIAAALTALIFLSASASVVHAQHELSYRFQKGQTYKFKKTAKETAYTEVQNSLSTSFSRETETLFSLTHAEDRSKTTVLRYYQDTAFVDETTLADANAALVIDFQNLLTGTPILLEVTPKGALQSAMPETSIPKSKNLARFGVNDRYLARTAMFLPALPTKPVIVGETWTDSVADTLVPAPKLGRENSLRIQSSEATYKAEGLETIKGMQCLKISWKAKILVEGKHIEGGLERFTEDRTDTEGVFYFALNERLPVSIKQTVAFESTIAAFGKEQGIWPSSTASETTIEYNP